MVLKCTMPKDLSTLIEQRDNLRKQMQLLHLREAALQKKIDKVVGELQEACPHEDVKTDDKYFGGGYDYCAETFYKQECRTCGKTIKTWSKTHYGIYG